jgi:hypothetical protein
MATPMVRRTAARILAIEITSPARPRGSGAGRSSRYRSSQTL